jgi:hypothetical protein
VVGVVQQDVVKGRAVEAVDSSELVVRGLVLHKTVPEKTYYQLCMHGTVRLYRSGKYGSYPTLYISRNLDVHLLGHPAYGK